MRIFNRHVRADGLTVLRGPMQSEEGGLVPALYYVGLRRRGGVEAITEGLSELHSYLIYCRCCCASSATAKGLINAAKGGDYDLR